MTQVRWTHIGGQALIEGVMMRGKDAWALAVLQPDGTLHEELHELPAKRRPRFATLPFVRGSFALFDSLSLGFKALGIAADRAFQDEDAQDGSSGFSTFEMGLSLLLGVTLAVALFMVLPAAVSQLVVGQYQVDPIAWNVVDGLARAALFVAYVWLIGRLPDIRRMFAFHGAEHKAIHCLEHGLALTPENARRFSCLHVRCGTAFLVMVILVAIAVYSVVPFDLAVQALGIQGEAPVFVAVLAMRLLLLPVIAGVSYEVTVKWAGRHPEAPLVRAVLWPGLQMQKLTTNEPDERMLECAVRAIARIQEHEASMDRG